MVDFALLDYAMAPRWCFSQCVALQASATGTHINTSFDLDVSGKRALSFLSVESTQGKLHICMDLAKSNGIVVAVEIALASRYLNEVYGTKY